MDEARTPAGPHGRRLAITVALAEQRLNAASAALWEHPRLRALFPEYLFDLYCAMRASVPIMEVALEESRARAERCPVAAALVPYFRRHIREEMHHDEWLLDDIERLGVPRAEVLARAPRPAVAALMGTQYYWIRHAHPVAFLGYTAVVEGNPVTAGLVDHLVARTGSPRDAFRTLYKHALLDAQHGADVWELIDALPLDAGHARLLGLSAVTALEQLADVIERLMEGAPEGDEADDPADAAAAPA